MKNSLKNFDYSLIERNAKVGVALSGGKDSVALFFTLLEYSKTFPITLIALNVEHGIREESCADSDFVKKLCEDNKIQLLSSSVKAVEFAKENKTTLETGARILRYEFFDDAIISGKVDYIALGHHQNDNAETVLFNILRGSGIKGGTGIAKTRGKYIRPMLDVSRTEINEFIASNNLPFVTDNTNFDNDYDRNYLRNIVIPTIEKRFPKAVGAISRFSENLSEAERDLSDMGKALVKLDGDKPYIKIDDLKYRSVFARGVFYAMSLIGITHEVYSKNIADIFSLCSKENGSVVNLTQNTSAIKEYDRIVFFKNEATSFFERDLSEGCFAFAGKEYIVYSDEKFEKKENFLAIDFDKLPIDAIIRTRREGDVFLRASGKVKLKEYLIDKKVPLRLRDNMLFIASGSEVFAVLSSECGKPLFCDLNTKKVLYITDRTKGVTND